MTPNESMNTEETLVLSELRGLLDHLAHVHRVPDAVALSVILGGTVGFVSGIHGGAAAAAALRELASQCEDLPPITNHPLERMAPVGRA